VALRDESGQRLPRIEAHRGSPRFAENSPAAIEDAVRAGYDGVEIDVRQLGDGSWVIHHDARTGRTVAVGPRPVPLHALTAAAWASGLLCGAAGRPPTLDEGLEAFARAAAEVAPGRPPPVLNVEVKRGRQTAAGDLLRLVRQVAGRLPAANRAWSSTDLRLLTCLRRTDPGPYLGLIVAHGKAATARRLSPEGLAEVRRRLGDEAGLHLDIRTLIDDPDVLRRVRGAGLRGVASWSVGGAEAHLQALGELAVRGMLPDTVIVDSLPTELRHRLAAVRGALRG
jgi:glycerophosphoryl diester phosphodiesterase